MRAYALLVLAACGSGEVKPRVQTTTVVAPVHVDTPVDASAPISRPDGDIEQLAVTLDGKAAVTIGEGGDARLWPALDGSLEPRILELPTTSSLAVETDTRGTAIAAIDNAGGLVLRIVDRTGAVVSSATLGPDVAFTNVVATTRGFLTARVDQSVAFATPDGVLGAPLAAETGQRIAAIAAASSADIALVQLDTDTGRGLRWLRLSPSLAWGKWIPTTTPPEGVIALSPSATRIGMLVDEDKFRTTLILDAKTGAVTMTNEDPRADEDDLVVPTETEAAVGYAALPHVRRVSLAAGPSYAKHKPQPTRRQLHRLAAVGGRVYTGIQESIAIDGPDGRTWLGYDISEYDEIVSAQDRVLSRTHDTLVELGPDLRERAHLSYENITGVEYAGGTQWLVETVDQVRNIATIQLVDTTSDAKTTVWSAPGTGGHLLFDTASRTLAVSGSNGVIGHVATDGTFQKLAELKTRSGEIFIAPIDKTRAGGVAAIAVTHDAGERIRWVTDPADLTKGVTTQLLEGSATAYDETGNVYVVKNEGAKYSVAVYRNGKLVTKSPADNLGAQVLARGDGKRIARTTFENFTVTDAANHTLWSTPHPGFARIAWLADGTLIAASFAGIARYNADTGERLAVRCGLAFGLHQDAPVKVASGAAMCSAL
jgi:hypothetical protein